MRIFSVDIDNLISELTKKGVIEEIQHKRLGTTELPAMLYVKLIIASLATKKSITNCVSTALETYTIRNEDKHLNEIRLQAAAVGKTIEEYLADAIAARLTRKSQEDEG